MITLKEQLLNELNLAPENIELRTFEKLDTGEENTMIFMCSKAKLIEIISNFDKDLHGSVPNGKLTTIKGWEIK